MSSIDTFMDGARLIVGLVCIIAGIGLAVALLALSTLALGRVLDRWWRS